MDTSQRGIDLIMGSEGKKIRLRDGRFKAYLDKLAKPPVWTIWAGLTKGVYDGMCLTEGECENMFRKELNVYEDAIEWMVTVKLNQNQFDALVSLLYNIGPGSPSDTKNKRGFYWSSIRKLLNQGKYEEAASRFKLYNKAGGVVYNGLITRRAREASLFLDPMVSAPTAVADDDQEIDINTAIPQRVESSVPTTTQIVASSQRAQWSIFSMIALAAQQAWEWLFGVAKEAGPEVLNNQQALSPFTGLLQSVGANVPTILAVIAFGSVMYVLVRHISAEKS